MQHRFFWENCWSSSFHMASWYTLIWVQLANSHFLVLVLHYIQQTCYPTNYLNLCFKLHSTNIIIHSIKQYFAQLFIPPARWIAEY